ncbi:hypothetical protein KSX_40060 [Ktedonospora formicarum]|uniref:Uncharacterized protein n=1 Tax=Ktedonospora formicarum TaxID=2778364 RepID=A0A8J3I4M2_9CHLR|nr:hypothetical protein KSX_40060 [Ktedonospora formicarum]
MHLPLPNKPRKADLAMEKSTPIATLIKEVICPFRTFFILFYAAREFYEERNQ